MFTCTIMTLSSNRRSFLKLAGTASASILGFPAIVHAQNKGDKLRVALIATGGKGGAHINMVKQAGDIVVAHCDVDTKRQGGVPKMWADSRFYQDYRILLERDEEHRCRDDLHPGPSSLSSHRPGDGRRQACVLQKPLVHTVWEARQLLGATKNSSWPHRWATRVMRAAATAKFMNT